MPVRAPSMLLLLPASMHTRGLYSMDVLTLVRVRMCVVLVERTYECKYMIYLEEVVKYRKCMRILHL